MGFAYLAFLVLICFAISIHWDPTKGDQWAYSRGPTIHINCLYHLDVDSTSIFYRSSTTYERQHTRLSYNFVFHKDRMKSYRMQNIEIKTVK